MMARFGPGKILIFSEGEYSDFGYCGQLVTLVDLDIAASVAEFKAGFKSKDAWDGPTPSGFVAWLCASRRCVQIDCTEIHLGEYGGLNDDPR